MNYQETEQQIRDCIERIKRSGALGRSPAYVKLLDYLADITFSGELCSEMSVAVDVFNKGDDFDVTSDSTVRVYIYNLRQKLAKYYEEAGIDDQLKLSIPKGAYRLSIERIKLGEEPDDEIVERELLKRQRSDNEHLVGAVSNTADKQIVYLLAGFCLVLLIALTLAFFGYISFPGSSAASSLSKEQKKFWGDLITDDKPVMIVIGDYYIFAEHTPDLVSGNEVRLVREFNINSEYELRQFIEQQDDESLPYRFDLGLTYLPRGSAFAISNVQEILTRAGKKPRITMMSEFSAEDLRANHIIYIGYISGLDVLESYMFSNSQFDVGYNYDEIIDTETDNLYRSDFIEAEDDRNFVDYGLISRSSISGDSLGDSHLVLLAGTRDAGLMEMSELVVSEDVLSRLTLENIDSLPYTALFEVYGFNLTNISSELIDIK